ncbi:unnamed protein product, partial [Vitis vinifera]|uniref:Uncharacterized protein n=1 Tax=Vitis vinifera TaxID=29760 RepID=D7TA78_VITVI
MEYSNRVWWGITASSLSVMGLEIRCAQLNYNVESSNLEHLENHSVRKHEVKRTRVQKRERERPDQQMRDGDSPVSSSTDVSFVIGYEGRMRMLQLTETYEFAEIFGGDHFPGKRKKAGKIERKVYR